MEKLNELQRITGGVTSKKLTSQDYIEYILKSGTSEEKRELLKCISGTLKLRGGELGF